MMISAIKSMSLKAFFCETPFLALPPKKLGTMPLFWIANPTSNPAWLWMRRFYFGWANRFGPTKSMAEDRRVCLLGLVGES